MYLLSRLTTILPIGGLGAEDKENDLRSVGVLLYVMYTYFCGLFQRGSLQFNTKNTWWQKQKIRDSSVAVSLDFLRKSVESVAKVYDEVWR
jgi:hypothetical protein